MRCQLSLVGAMMVCAVLASTPVQAQQGPSGVITGRVIDAENKEGIPEVQVRVVNSTQVTRTAADGRYRFVNVPAGAQRVQVFRLGYASQTQAADVTAGGTTTVDFALTAASATLQAQVITAPSGVAEQAKVNGASIGIIPVDSVEQTPITNFSELLNSRVAGLTVIQNSGEVGAGARMDIRGTGSAALSNQPLIVIDGIRAYNDVNGFSDLGGVGGQLISRFDDLDHENIADVQVLRGPAAAALYGTEAAAGVIVITTQHGEAGQAPRWDFFAKLGRLNDQGGYPPNYGRLGAGSTPAAPITCSLVQEYEQACVGLNGPLGATGAFSYDLIGSTPWAVNGYDEGTGLDVRGGNPLITYFTGVNWERQQGVYQNNSDRWTHVSSAFTIHPYSILDLNLTALYTQRRTALPLSDNAQGGILTAMLLGGPFPGDYFDGFNPLLLEKIVNDEATDRFTIGASGTLRILPWLTAAGTVGMDYVGIYDNQYITSEQLPLDPTGQATAANNSVFEYTGSAALTAKYPIPIVDRLNGTTTFGGEWVDESLRQVNGFGQGLLFGTGSLAGASTNFDAFEVNSDIVNVGGFLRQEFAWRNVLFGSISGRLDGNSAFGHNNSTAFYPAGSLSYVISDENFWPRQDYISSLRLRAAGGQSGREPTFRLAEGTFTNGAYCVGNPPGTAPCANQTGAIVNSIGNANLKPERSTEYEAGFDVGFWKDRFNLTATVYDRVENDLVQAEPIDISTGGATANVASSAFIVTNLGKIDNRGIELTFNGNIVRTTPVSFDMGAFLAVQRNKLVSQGPLPPNVIASGGFGNPIQEDIAGQPVGVFLSVPYTYKDLHHNGIITPDDITYGTKPVFVGEPGPREELTLSPTITIFKYFKVNALFDRRDGSTVFDQTDEFRCLGPFQVGRDCNDPKAPLKDQAAAVAFNTTGTDYGYLLNGSFWKVREVSFKLLAPDSWARRYLGGRSASLTVSGRNLATWSPFRGIDPEVNEFGGSATIASAQFFEQPPLRAWIARIDLSW